MEIKTILIVLCIFVTLIGISLLGGGIVEGFIFLTAGIVGLIALLQKPRFQTREEYEAYRIERAKEIARRDVQNESRRNRW